MTPLTSLTRAVYDVVIMGGGAMGSSIAYHLASASSALKILVVERDRTYARSSSTLSAGGIRQQFSIPENVSMSMYGIDFLHNINQLRVDSAVDIQLREHGYLFLASDTGKSILEQNHSVQHGCGARWIHLLDSSTLGSRYPWLRLHNIVSGSASDKNEGYFDPWAFLMALKQKSRSLGVTYLGGNVIGAHCLSTNAGTMKISDIVVKSSADSSSIFAGTFINAAGAWAGGLMDVISRNSSHPVAPVPIEARKRCIFQFECPDIPTAPPLVTPLVVLPDGTWFRPEGTSFIAGVSPPEDQDPHCSDEALDNPDYSVFQDIIWPSLVQYVPAFEELKLRRSWAGFYDYNVLDQNAIIGAHPDISNLLLCTGFSGHGLQHAPAAGRAIAELVMHGRFKTLDLTCFSFDRVKHSRPLQEQAIV